MAATVTSLIRDEQTLCIKFGFEGQQPEGFSGFLQGTWFRGDLVGLSALVDWLQERGFGVKGLSETVMRRLGLVG